MLAAFFVRVTVYAFRLMPFWLVYVFSFALYLLLFYVVRYRRKLVLQNLSKAFPEREKSELKKLRRQYFRYLADLMVESLKGLTLSDNELKKRMCYTNPEITDNLYAKNQSFIGTGAHYGNWEWEVISKALHVKHTAVGIYKPIQNPPVERFVSGLRKRTGMVLVGIEKTKQGFETHLNDPACFLMLSDQNPSSLKRAVWVDFLNSRLPFLHGMEAYARKHEMPVLHFSIQRIKRGYYTLTAEPLTKPPYNSPFGTLTELYAKKIEEEILRQPQYWLWTHRRWKHEGKEQALK